MSKYFNQTLKARNEVLTDEVLKASLQEPAQEIEPTPPVPVVPAVPFEAIPGAVEMEPSGTSDVVAARLRLCRKIHLPLEKLHRVQFANGNAQEPAEESYRALRTRLLRMRLAQGLRSVVITSSIQGEGKTLTSLNLALCCSQLNDMRVLLIDADIRTCGLSRALEALPGPGLADVLSGQCRPEEAILATDRPNLFLLSSGAPAMPAAELFANRRWQDFVAWCNETFSLTLVDSPPVLNLSDVELISAGCDGVLVVVRALYTKRQVLQKAAGQVDPKKLLGVIYNGGRDGTHHKYQNRYYRGDTKDE
jgi:protein-tyrosine kinase